MEGIVIAEVMRRSKSNKLISVIIPVYNAEPYLQNCLNSVCKQSYKNMEILCVDDGSTDETGKILDYFCEKDFRVKVIHQSNHGESHARNTGLDMAGGEYIAFVDCDDWIEPDMYEQLLRALESSDVDIAIGGWFRETDNESITVKNRLPIECEIFDRETLLHYIYRRDDYQTFAYMWDKLYRRDLIEKDRKIRFHESLKLGGDVVFLAEVALKTKKAMYVDAAFYHYRQREVSGSHTDDLESMRHWIQAYEIVIERLMEEKISEDIVNYAKRFLAYHSSNAAEKAVMQKNPIELTLFQSFMKQYEKEYCELNREKPDRIKRYKSILHMGIEE